MSKVTPSSKVLHFEGLRGFAAFIVFLHHYVLAFYPAMYTGLGIQAHNSFEVPVSGTPLRLFYSGSLPISVFFCLSGFVLSIRFFKTKDSMSVVSGAARRYVRLVIPILAASTFVFVLMSLGVFHNHEAAYITRSDWLYKYFGQSPDFTIMLRESIFDVFYHNSRAYNPVLWTMQVELYGSFLVFGSLLVFGRLRYRPLAYAALVILFFDTYYLGFILGMLVSDLSANGLFARLKDKLPLVAGLLVAGITLGLYNIPENGSRTMYSLITFNTPDVKFGILYTTLGAAMILFALVNSTHMQRFFSNRVMDFLGKLSFSLYLLHLSIIFTFSCFMFGYLERSLTYNSSVLLTFPPTLALVVASSWVMYRYVDTGSVWAGKLLWEKVYGMAKKAAPGR